MPVIFIPAYDHGKREILEISPGWACFADQSNPRAIFIDGYHYHEGQLFRTREAADRYWSKLSVPSSDRFTVAELVSAWGKRAEA